jgi:hypothetical protein
MSGRPLGILKHHTREYFQTLMRYFPDTLTHVYIEVATRPGWFQNKTGQKLVKEPYLAKK